MYFFYLISIGNNTLVLEEAVLDERALIGNLNCLCFETSLLLNTRSQLHDVLEHSEESELPECTENFVNVLIKRFFWMEV